MTCANARADALGRPSWRPARRYAAVPDLLRSLKSNSLTYCVGRSYCLSCEWRLFQANARFANAGRAAKLHVSCPYSAVAAQLVGAPGIMQAGYRSVAMWAVCRPQLGDSAACGVYHTAHGYAVDQFGPDGPNTT